MTFKNGAPEDIGEEILITPSMYVSIIFSITLFSLIESLVYIIIETVNQNTIYLRVLVYLTYAKLICVMR